MMGPADGASERVEHHGAFVTWLQRWGWRILAYVFLTTLAVANVYPFLWMTGTSLKETDEAINDKEYLLPGLKFELADLPFLEPFYEGNGGRPVNNADRKALEEAREEADEIFAELTRRDQEDDRLHDSQREFLKTLRYDNIRRKSINDVFVPKAIGYRQYTESAGDRYKITETVEEWVEVEAEEGPDGAAGIGTGADRPSEKELVTKEVVRYDYASGLADLKQLEGFGMVQGVRAQPKNYHFVWTQMKFWMYTATSFLITAGVVIITILMTSMLGYALARIRFPGKWLLLGLMIVGAVAPSEAAIIPVFRFLLATGMLENLWGTVVWIAGVSIGNALLMAGFFLTLPKEVEEAAYVDGAGPFRTFFLIAMPMAKPIIYTVGLFAFLGAWNQFIIPLITSISKMENQPLAMAVYMFRSGYEQNWNWINAASAIMVVPVIILFIFLQRFIVNAIAVGAVKG